MDRIITGLVDEFQKNYALAELTESEVFEAFAAYCVLNSYYEEDFNPDEFRTGGGNDLGIDALAVLVNGILLQDSTDVRAHIERSRRVDVQIVVIQAKTTAGFEARVISDLADNLSHITGTGSLPYAASEDIVNFRECLEAVYGNIAKLSGALPELHVHYVTTGDRVADMVASKAASASERLRGLGRFERVEFRCVTRDDLRQLYRRATTKVAVQFPMPRKMSLPKVSDVEQALLGLLSARDLVMRILVDESGRLRKTLFHGNVRDYLGDENPVNREIANTLRDPSRRERFAVLNNGITIVTRGLHVVGDDVYLDDFEIVNGCQTCHVLFEHRDELTDNVQVSVRIVHSHDEDVINGIVGATNRQTTISEEDLTIRESFHRLLEDYFGHSRDPERRLFYERRTKQYAHHRVEKTRIITRAQLIRSYTAMFLGEPTRRGQYRSLISSDSGNLFAEGHQPVVYYTAAAAFYRLDWLLRNGRIPKNYAPYRFHILSAIKLRVLGRAPIQHTSRTAERECQRILDVMWDKAAAEGMVLNLLTPLQRAIDAEQSEGVAARELARTQRFTKRVSSEILSPTSP
ncbi:AIPR family protein [Saccharothrix sp. S26]|uniref:AIPR family protein n=1 Tax=Saccharothrix sp. S26 TaxID=2907215 RepID=UPI001F3F02A6|nr:AIPR family protein [Saccharothrix sp. S26]MCE6998592.1 AIPR family protein [Saccharothrix sp. S26]